MKKRLLVFTSILAISLTLQACGNSSKATNIASQATKTESQDNKEENKKVENPNLQSYQELTAYAKKQTSQFAKIMTDNNIENVLTPDNMYAVNTKQTYKKYDKDYEFHAEYLYNPKLSANDSSNSGNMSIEYAKGPDDTFSVDDNHMKFLTQVINEMFDGGKNITTDELVNTLNDAIKTNTKDVEKNFDKKDLKIGVTKDGVGLGKNDYFTDYKLTSPQKTYDTVHNFLDNNIKKQKLKDFFAQSGFKGAYNEDSNNKDVINVNCEADDQGEKFTDDYYVSCKFLNYDLKDTSKNESVKVLYNFIKEFTLNTDLSEEEFGNYISSRILYEIYQFDPRELGNVSGEGFPYYMPLVNVAANQNSTSKYPAFDISFNGKISQDSITIDKGNKKDNITSLPSIILKIKFNVPVVAEGVTKR